MEIPARSGQHTNMPKAIYLIAIFVGFVCACQKGHAPNGPIGDLVIRNARVYTVDAQRPWAQAVTIKGESIVWVGDENDVGTHIGPTTKVIDAGGRMLLPGFIDSHFHVCWAETGMCCASRTATRWQRSNGRCANLV
jgi:formylmethanofuran dehydrogenase subunit A